MSNMERQESDFSFLEAELPASPLGRRPDYVRRTSASAPLFDTIDNGSNGCESLPDSPQMSEGAYSQDDFEETEDQATLSRKYKSRNDQTSISFVPEDSAGNGVCVKISQLTPHTSLEAPKPKKLVDRTALIESSKVTNHPLKPNTLHGGDGLVQLVTDIRTAAPVKPLEIGHDFVEPNISNEGNSSVKIVDSINNPYHIPESDNLYRSDFQNMKSIRERDRINVEEIRLPIHELISKRLVTQVCGSGDSVVGYSFGPEIVRSILRDSQMFEEREISEWRRSVTVPVGKNRFHHIPMIAARAGLRCYGLLSNGILKRAHPSLELQTIARKNYTQGLRSRHALASERYELNHHALIESAQVPNGTGLPEFFLPKLPR
jgi:hypothetical protein